MHACMHGAKYNRTMYSDLSIQIKYAINKIVNIQKQHVRILYCISITWTVKNMEQKKIEK